MVEADLEQIGRAGVAGDMAAQLAIGLVGAHHHGQGVPAHQRRQALLDRQVAREHRLLLRRDAVDMGGVELGLPAHAAGMGRACQLIQDEARALRALGGHQGGKGIAPFGGLLRVGVQHGVQGRNGRGGIHGRHCMPECATKGIWDACCRPTSRRNEAHLFIAISALLTSATAIFHTNSNASMASMPYMTSRLKYRTWTPSPAAPSAKNSGRKCSSVGWARLAWGARAR